MPKKKTITIHGNEYLPVSERVNDAHEKEKQISITTEVLLHTPNVVVKATVTTSKGVFTGTSMANPSKAIEKQSPYEVAETSAVGRALGFAGFGLTEGIASADEMKYAKVKEKYTPEEARHLADLAIEEATEIDELAKINTQIVKSKFINNDDKTILVKKLTQKLQTMNPLE